MERFSRSETRFSLLSVDDDIGSRESVRRSLSLESPDRDLFRAGHGLDGLELFVFRVP
jgi:hypothetical protein